MTVGYGMTECGPLISYAPWNKTKATSAGRVVHRMQVRIDSEDPYNVVVKYRLKAITPSQGITRMRKPALKSLLKMAGYTPAIWALSTKKTLCLSRAAARI